MLVKALETTEKKELIKTKWCQQVVTKSRIPHGEY
jgi:hypothetical protein